MIIEGFKSYKDQTIAEPFSEKINTVGKLMTDRRPEKVIVFADFNVLQLEPTVLASLTFSTVSLIMLKLVVFPAILHASRRSNTKF